MKDIFNSWLVNKYVAHRGLHDKESPENSLGAFRKAVEKDYVIELDVHPLADGTPVVFHDELLNRMTGKDGYISQIKDEESLKDYTLLNSDEKIPTLKEVLELVDGKTQIIVEIKAVTELNDIHRAQVFNYLKASNFDLALLVNFGEIPLKIERIFNYHKNRQNSPTIP